MEELANALANGTGRLVKLFLRCVLGGAALAARCVMCGEWLGWQLGRALCHCQGVDAHFIPFIFFARMRWATSAPSAPCVRPPVARTAHPPRHRTRQQ